MNKEHGNHTQHHKMMIKDFRRRFYISVIATAPILALSEFIQDVFGFSISIPGARYIILGISTFVYFYGGWPFLKGLFSELKSKKPGMMTLIALAISVAYFYSAAVSLGLEGKTFFWELATLIDIMLAGHWIEMRSVLSASSALEKLAELMPHTAHKKAEGEIIEVELSDIQAGDVLVIKPGEKVPSDGKIIDGESYIDESMLTGESKPVKKSKGDDLIGGSINGDGSLELKVEKTGEDSYLSKVIELVREAQETKSKTQALSDKAAFWLTIIAVTVGFATLAGWLLAGRDFQFSLARMATVMVITCPHALGLAIPLVVSVSTTKSAQNGLLIRNRTSFENARNITTVVFDKTGTLTKGIFGVSSISVHDKNYSEKDVIELAAALESKSEHPIGKGIMEKAKEMNIKPASASDFQAMKGKGIRGEIDGSSAAVVSRGYLQEIGIQVPGDSEKRESVTLAYVLHKDRLIGAIALEDSIRLESYTAIEELHKKNIKCWMLTGDNEETAKSVAEELGMDGYFAEVLPDEKQDKIKELQRNGEYVAMTGDGVNDAPALAQAEVGIAVGSGTDVAASTADIVLVNSNPIDITSLILFGKATFNKMIQNLIWATAYNVVAIPLAAGVLAGVGIILSPAIGAVLMSASTVIVAINARLLRMPARELKEKDE